MTYVIASSKVWRPQMPAVVAEKTGHPCVAITRKEELTPEYLASIQAEMIFFPHWSYLIPAQIYERYECVVFHMTDLPFGRGGSPLQNLIVRGIYETKISALRCVKELDAGPIYLKRPLSLDGTANEIYRRASEIIEEMIITIIRDRPQPVEQVGEVVTFQRRRERDGDISRLATLQQIYDYIRMLDADGYPRAFIETETLRVEFSDASLQADEVTARVAIKLRKPHE